MKKLILFFIFVSLYIFSIYPKDIYLIYNLKKGDIYNYNIEIKRSFEDSQLVSNYTYQLKILDIKNDKYFCQISINDKKYKFSFDKYGNIKDFKLSNINFSVYPDKKLNLGDRWDIKANYIVKTLNNILLNTKVNGFSYIDKIENNFVFLKQNYDIYQKGDGLEVKGKGESYQKIDLKTGLVFESKTILNLNIPFDMQRGRKKHQDLKVEIKVNRANI